MSSNLTMYQVVVEVLQGQHYGDYPVHKGSKAIKGAFIRDTIHKMFHIEARTPEQAANRCKKHGKPVSVCKVNVKQMHKNFEELPILNSVYADGNPYNSAVAMDEMIWEKRNKRRDNLYKDKKNI